MAALTLAVPNLRNRWFELRAESASAAIILQTEGGFVSHCSAVAFEKQNDTVYLATAKHCLLVDAEEMDDPSDEALPNKSLFVSFSSNEQGPFYPVTESFAAANDDVAILKIRNAEDVVTIPLGDETKLSAGDRIENLSFPMEFGKTEFFGEFIAPRFSHTPGITRDIANWKNAMPASLISAPGSSGSGVFDPYRHTIIGIVVGNFQYGDLSVLEPVSLVARLRKAIK